MCVGENEGAGEQDGVPPDFPEFVADHQQQQQQEEGGFDGEGIERVRGDNAAPDVDAIHMVGQRVGRPGGGWVNTPPPHTRTSVAVSACLCTCRT